MSILHPLSVKKRTLQSAAAAMAGAWGIAVLFSALPLLNLDYYGDEFYGNNGVCLPLHIHDPFGQVFCLFFSQKFYSSVISFRIKYFFFA